MPPMQRTHWYRMLMRVNCGSAGTHTVISDVVVPSPLIKDLDISAISSEKHASEETFTATDGRGPFYGAACASLRFLVHVKPE